jgi:hypothetical protein
MFQLKWNKNAVPGKPLKRKLPGTNEEEKCEKNKRYDEHRPERKLNTKWQDHLKRGGRGNVNNKTIRNIYCYEHCCSHTILLLVGFI